MKVQRNCHCTTCGLSFYRERNLRRHHCRPVVPLMSLKLPPRTTPPRTTHWPAADRLPTPPPLPPSPSLFLPSPLPPPKENSLPPSPGIRLSPAQSPEGPKTPTYFSCSDGSPMMSDVAPSPSPPSTLLTPSMFRRPLTCDVGTQADAVIDHRDRARRRIFEDQQNLGHLCPTPAPRPGDPDAPRDIFLRVDLRHQRRLCDCSRCVRHAIRLATSTWAAEVPTHTGLRFVTPPDLPTTSSTSNERRKLVQLVTSNPEKSLVVCSCAHCTVHRNLLCVWMQARRLLDDGAPRRPPPPPPAVGGCRNRD